MQICKGFLFITFTPHIERTMKTKKHLNKNFKYLVTSFDDQEYVDKKLVKGFRGVGLEGSSRSSKTISSIDFIIWLCSTVETNCTINIVKETFAEFKTTLYDDFKMRLSDFGLDNPFLDRKEIKSFKIMGSKINFIGCDKINKAHGSSCDYLWLNEPLPISKELFDQFEMRCRKFWWLDYNPSVTKHWIYDMVSKRPDVGHVRSTFRDNLPFISDQELNKILSYEPWQSGSYEVTDQDIFYNGQVISKTNQPPPHPTNLKNGTADEFMWKVYGLGLRGAMKGVIFKNVKYIDTFPDVAFHYGMDFGFTVDPLALVKYAQVDNNIYLELLCYHPVDNSADVDALLTSLGVSKGTPITADSADKYTGEGKGTVQMVNELYEIGWEISKVSKVKGVMYWVGNMKTYNIHIVKNDMSHHAQKEQENYVFKEINGIPINAPIDKHNHFWDACFVGETLITTDKGQVPMVAIKKGDRVLTRGGYQTVLNKWNNGKKQTFGYWMHFDTFSLHLQCTEDHKIKTDNGWIKISQLEQGATVYLTNRLEVLNTGSIKGKDILQREQGRCTGMYGSQSCKKEKKGITYTILTAIQATTKYATLEKLRQASTYQNILRKGLEKILNGLRALWLKEKWPQENGTLQKQVISGTLYKGEIHGNNENPLINNVSNAVVNMKIGTEATIQSSVQINARPSIEGIAELITKNENADGVVNHGLPINTQKQDSVQKFVVQRIDSQMNQIRYVYDIEVENIHEYFANGVLVHNCRYAHMANSFSNLEVEWS